VTGERGLKRGRKRRTCLKKNLYYTLVKLHHRLQIRSHQDPKSSLIAVAVLTGDTSNKVTRLLQISDMAKKVGGRQSSQVGMQIVLPV
jgi:hypothetical protein